MNVKSVCGACGEVAVEVKGMMPLPGHIPGQENEPDGAGFIKKRRAAKKRRLHTLGAVAAEHQGKSGEDDDSFMCAASKKMMAEGADVCDDCPGGCKSEKSLLSLIEAEGLAEELFEAEVTDSAYSAKNDAMIVQMRVADGRFVEAFWDAKTADFKGWIFVKAAEEEIAGLSDDEIQAIAVKTIEGEVTGMVNDTFENETAWAVSLTGADGNEYDVFVSPDGKVLGYDIYETEMKAADPEDEEDPEEAPEEGEPMPETSEEVPEEDPEDMKGKKDDEDEILEEKTEVVVDDFDFLKALAEFQAISLEE